jgi:hypothetical protein
LVSVSALDNIHQARGGERGVKEEGAEERQDDFDLLQTEKKMLERIQRVQKGKNPKHETALSIISKKIRTQEISLFKEVVGNVHSDGASNWRCCIISMTEPLNSFTKRRCLHLLITYFFAYNI